MSSPRPVPIFDGHNDVLLRLYRRGGTDVSRAFLEGEAKGQLDLPMKDDVLAPVLHIEGAEAIDPNFEFLDVLYEAGLRSLGPVWSRPNAFGHGVPFRCPSSPDTGPGLTDLGKELIGACNRLGILIDLSHLNERGFWDVAAISNAPLVATHSNAHALSRILEISSTVNWLQSVKPAALSASTSLLASSAEMVGTMWTRPLNW